VLIWTFRCWYGH